MQIGLSSDGETIALRKFNGGIPLPEATTRTRKSKRVLIVDTETTGLNTEDSEIIDLCIASLRYDESTGELLAVESVFESLNEPSTPISAEITELTGITNAMVKGYKIPLHDVRDLLEGADLAIAHNAGFDRPMLCHVVPSAASLIWGCSYRHIAWDDSCGKSLGSLARDHGFFFDGHRARSDVEALTKLLMTDPKTVGRAQYYLRDVIDVVSEPSIFVAITSPFEAKETIKSRRGYFWNAGLKNWCKILRRGELADETKWHRELSGRYRISVSTGEVPQHKLFEEQYVPSSLTRIQL